MNCLALDDEPLALQLLEVYAGRLPQLSPQGFFNNPDQAMQRLEAGDIELLFLDIQMPDINGLQFLKQLEQPPMVVFTTAFAEFAVEGFNLDAIDYLLKPFDFQRFEKAVTKAVEYRQFLISQKSSAPQTAAEPAANSLFVKVEYSIVQIAFDDIRYIESFDDYIKIYTTGKPILTLTTLKTVLSLLPLDRFMQVHRSFIIALDKIERVRAQKITIMDREIPVSDSFKDVLKKVLSK